MVKGRSLGSKTVAHCRRSAGPVRGDAGLHGPQRNNGHRKVAVEAQGVGKAQCAEAVEAPSPVSERTCCAANSARSFAAWRLLSVTENSQMPTKPMVIENSA